LDETVLTALITKLLPNGRREARLNVGDFVFVGGGT
jgi:hypothetical protein